MYLARIRVRGKIHYFIRQSYHDPETDLLVSRDLFDLGPDPSRFIIYQGGTCYYVDERVEDAIRSSGVEPAGDVLDDIFWPFVQRDIRKTLAPFRQPRKYIRTSKLSGSELELIRTGIHLFDKRRMYYLRYGNIDQSRMGRVPPKLYRKLLYKSRDELEQFFMDLERSLETTEYRQYVYVIFNLQHHFSQLTAKHMPQALNQEKLDDVFLHEIGKLNSDLSFWAGMGTGERLHDYLTRYVIMFFDYDFGPSSFMDDYIRQFMNSRRQFRFPKKAASVTIDEASTVFGVSKDGLIKMSKRELTRLYRTRAHELHPDKGGEHDTFVRLTQAYQDLLKRKQ